MNNLFMYHAANCLLQAPLKSQINDEWENSPSYLTCSTHAFQGTAQLAAALRGTAAVPMSVYSPYYMVCTWVLGLIHILFLRRTLVYILDEEWEIGLSEDNLDILLVHTRDMRRIVEPTMPTPAGLLAGRYESARTAKGGMQAASHALGTARAWRTAGAGIRAADDPHLVLDLLRSSGIVFGPEFDAMLGDVDGVVVAEDDGMVDVAVDDGEFPPTPVAQGVTNTMTSSGLDPGTERLLSQALGQAQLHLQALQTFGTRVPAALNARRKLITVLLGEEPPSRVHVFRTVIEEMGIDGVPFVQSAPAEMPRW